MIETDIWLKLRDQALKRLMAPERYENAVSSGTFDCSVSYKNKTFWIELKKNGHQKLRVRQLAWARKRLSAQCKDDMFILFKNSGDYYCLVEAYFALAKPNDILIHCYPIAYPSMGELVAHLQGIMEKS